MLPAHRAAHTFGRSQIDRLASIRNDAARVEQTVIAATVSVAPDIRYPIASIRSWTAVTTAARFA